MKITPEKINYLIATAQYYKLDGCDIFARFTMEEMLQIYNGAGADSQSKYTRMLQTHLLSLYEPCFLIHDLDYTESDGTRKGFNNSNSRLYENMRKIREHEYPWWAVSKYPICAYWWGKGQLAYQAVCLFGWDGYE